VLAMSELTLETSLDDEQREWLSIIQRSAQELTRIIDDVLDFSRIETDKLKVENAPFDLGELLDATESLFAPQAREKRIGFRTELPSDLHSWYRGDEYRIRQVLYNLLSNAIKFTPRGEVVFTVRSQPISEFLNELTFSVRDTGIGICDSLRETIFDSFTQGDASYSKAYQGTGLGLSISRRLAKLMGGQLYFTSSEGEGSTFYFTVPLHLEDDQPALKPDDDGANEPTPATRRVLIAEDNAVNVLVVRTVLERAGYEVETAANGDEALSLLGRSPFDLVLMDISMPNVDGMEATRRVRAGELSGVDAAVPIVAITAHSMHGDREEFLAAGMDDYLAKPFSKQALLDVVTRLVRGRASRG